VAGFQHILVPLDGSEVSELALDAAQQAARLNGRLTLVRVTDILADHYLPDDADKEAIWQKQIAPVREYLDLMKAGVQREDLTVQTEVASGFPADVILEMATEDAVDAVAMCTHTESKLRKFLLGSVANKVIDTCSVPVIIVHP
jgi:nucleotide-binding universal stress UspA family protein